MAASPPHCHLSSSYCPCPLSVGHLILVLNVSPLQHRLWEKRARLTLRTPTLRVAEVADVDQPFLVTPRPLGGLDEWLKMRPEENRIFPGSDDRSTTSSIEEVVNGRYPYTFTTTGGNTFSDPLTRCAVVMYTVPQVHDVLGNANHCSIGYRELPTWARRQQG